MKRALCLALVAAALIVLGSVPLPWVPMPESFGPLMLGGGCTLLGVAVSAFLEAQRKQRLTQRQRLRDIEKNDERNRLIRWRAQALAGTVTQWLLLAMALVMIILRVPLWLILITVLIYVGHTVVWLALSAHYQKKM